MVNGLETFKQYFDEYKHCYVLIGGSACDICLEDQGLPFRVTYDFDIVLCVEALTDEFFKRFWQFVREGGYQLRQRSDGQRQFYRFSHSTNREFPAMVELFARRADFLPPDIVSTLTPIPAGEEASSLSGILLDQDCYDYVMQNRMEVDGVTILTPKALIVLKAIAWLDLKTRREATNEHIDSKDINKHKNDILRLVSIVDVENFNLPQKIQQRMSDFLTQYSKLQVDMKSLGIQTTFEDMLKRLEICFGIE